MLEYGIKTITTTPTLITKSKEIIKLIDSRTKKTRAFVVPAFYAPYIEKIEKDIKYKEWVAKKKAILKHKSKDDLEDIEKIGMESIDIYLGDS